MQALVFLAIGLFVLIAPYWLDTGKAHTWLDLIGLGLLIVGAAMMAIEVLRPREPMK